MKNKLPDMYSWLLQEPGPKILLEVLKIYGTLEVPGEGDNPEILAWAKEVGIEKTYVHDATPWCGLTVALCVKRAGKEVVKDPLWAANWLKFGNACDPELGAIAVFSRDGGNHVAVIVGEDATHYHVIGGNQKDSVSIMRLAKDRLRGCRALYQTKPANVRRVTLAATGEVSKNES